MKQMSVDYCSIVIGILTLHGNHYCDLGRVVGLYPVEMQVLSAWFHKLIPVRWKN